MRAAQSLHELIDDKHEYLVLEAWIIGVHFKDTKSIEYTGYMKALFVLLSLKYINVSSFNLSMI